MNLYFLKSLQITDDNRGKVNNTGAIHRDSLSADYEVFFYSGSAVTTISKISSVAPSFEALTGDDTIHSPTLTGTFQGYLRVIF